MAEPPPGREPSELEELLASKEPAAVLNAILGFTPSGAVIAAAPDGRIVRVSDFVESMLGRPRSELEGRTIGKDVRIVFAFDSEGHELPVEDLPLFHALRGETVIGYEAVAQAADGELIPCLVSAAPIRNAQGELIGVITSIADLRRYKALERSLREAVAQRETLYRELAHRVKNHLQIMSGLISMEARDPTLTAAGLADLMKGRLQALAAVYDGMTQAGVGARIGAGAFIEEVCRPFLFGSMTLETAVDPVDLTLASEQAGPVGMLINEAVSNSWKHAFQHQPGWIRVSLARLKPGRLRLEIADDGVGLTSQEEDGRVSHGLELMRIFASQLRGQLELRNRPEGGTLAAVELPETAEPA